jgi:sugar/nucleoside kinase (ribokinase family)
MSLEYDVIVVGSYSVDLIFTGLPEFPQLGKDTVGTGFMMTPGEAYITAVSMHRLGLKVGWAGDFGNDDFSNLTLRRARQEGLDESLFIFHNQPYRRVSAAASFPHELGFITYYDPDPPIPAAIEALMKAKARLVLVPGLYTGSFLTIGRKFIRAKKMLLAMDGNSSTGDILGNSKQCKAIRKAIKNVDIFLPNASEARRITGEQELERAARRLGDLCNEVVIKDGANGSYACVNGQVTHVAAIDIIPVDTTGAGDNFNAGYLFGRLNNYSIEICLKWGNILGGLSTTELGGTTKKITVELASQYLQ